MNFNLTDEQQMLQDTLSRYLADNYNNDFRNELTDSKQSYSKKVWQELSELGVIGALFAEEDGGYGGAPTDIAVVFEELGRAGSLEPFLESGVLCGGLIAELGNEQQKQQVASIIDGSSVFAFLHAEPQSHYDLDSVVTVASESSDGFLLNGTKSAVRHGSQADQFLVSARLGDANQGELGLFLVDTNASGIKTREYQLITGEMACDVLFENCQIPAASRLGESINMDEAIEKHVARAIAALCAEALGAMDSAVKLTVDYLKERKQFGVPLGKFQVLQHRMADLLIDVEQARSAVVNVCGNLDAGRITRERNVSAAKNLIGRVGRKISEESIQLHGGMGMTMEYALGYFAKRLVAIDHQLGDTDYHLERFVNLSY